MMLLQEKREMRASRIRLMIITPLLPPAPGGGGIYTELLVRGLLENKYCESVLVVTEKYPGYPASEYRHDGRCQVLRHFPFRAGAKSQGFARYIKYAVQNLDFFGLRKLAKRHNTTHVLIHSSFHNNPSVMRFVVRSMKKSGVVAIADVRDPKLAVSRFSELYPYDGILCCSENIMARFIEDPVLSKKLAMVPIIVNVSVPTETEISQCKRKYTCTVPYVFNGSGISAEKGVNRLLAAIERINLSGKYLRLVVAGKRRDWTARHDEAVKKGYLIYVGPIPHRDVLCLSAGAEVDANLSRVDSMPRASLEAIIVGSRVLLPSGVPEFEPLDQSIVANRDEPELVAAQLLSIIENDIRPQFDVASYSPANVLPHYFKLFQDLHNIGLSVAKSRSECN